MGKSRQQADITERPCPVCGTPFTPYRSSQRACSRPCRDRLPVSNDVPWAREREFDCTMCGRSFTRVSTSGRSLYCDTCKPLAEEARAERKNASRRVDVNPERRGMNYRQNLARYGLTSEQHAAMLAAQGGVCAICGDAPNPNGVRAASRLHIDHDHESGRVRALLCNHCNRGIGAFRDSPELLAKAIDYLKTHEA